MKVDIGFIVALEKEAEYFLAQSSISKIELIANKKVYVGSYNGKPFALVISGIGKVNASFSTQLLIDRFSPELLFNFGSSGGISEETEILNYYLIDSACQFDVLVLPHQLGYLPEYKTSYFQCLKIDSCGLEYKTLASSDRFSFRDCDYQLIKSFKASIYDMEGGAIAQVAHSNNLPLVILKGITDVSNNNNLIDFQKNLNKLSRGFIELINKIIKEI